MTIRAFLFGVALLLAGCTPCGCGSRCDGWAVDVLADVRSNDRLDASIDADTQDAQDRVLLPDGWFNADAMAWATPDAEPWVFVDATQWPSGGTSIDGGNEAGCETLTPRPPPRHGDASCGEGCEVLSNWAPDFDYLGTIGPLIRFAAGGAVLDIRDGQTSLLWIAPSAIHGFAVSGGASSLLWSNLPWIELDEFSVDGTQRCARLRYGPTPTQVPQLGRSMTSFTGGLAWTGILTRDAVANEVFLWRRPDSFVTQLTHCGCAAFVAGGGDRVTYVASRNGTNEVWTTLAPFTQARLLWTTPDTVVEISADEGDPANIVMLVGAGHNIDCADWWDLILIDAHEGAALSARRITYDGRGKGHVRIASNRVLYSEFRDPSDAHYCFGFVPASMSLTLLDTRNLSSTTIYDRVDAVGVNKLYEGTAYILYNGNLGRIHLPW